MATLEIVKKAFRMHFSQQCTITRAELVPLLGYYLAPSHMPFPCPFTSGKYKFHTLISLPLFLSCTHAHTCTHTHKHAHAQARTRSRASITCQRQQMLLLCFCASKLLSGLYQEMGFAFCRDGYGSKCQLTSAVKFLPGTSFDATDVISHNLANSL